jgi:hypothetical protein
MAYLYKEPYTSIFWSTHKHRYLLSKFSFIEFMFIVKAVSYVWVKMTGGIYIQFYCLFYFILYLHVTLESASMPIWSAFNFD